MIRRLITLALAMLAVALFCGCMQVHTDTVIDKNGGGTATMSMSISQNVLEAIEQMQELDPDSEAGDLPNFDEIDEGEIKDRLKGFNVKLTKFEKKDVDGRQTVIMEYKFDDMKGLSVAMGSFMGDSDGDENGLGIFDAGDGNLVLRPATYDLPAWEEEEDEVEEEAEDMSMEQMDPEAMQKQMAIMGTLMASASELDVSMKITVPGDIVSTNAPEQDGRTSIWSINSNNMMTAGGDMKPEIVFSGKGVNIKPMTE